MMERMRREMERVECVGKQMVRNQDRKNKFHEVMQEKN
jgi:hypothetical protein